MIPKKTLVVGASENPERYSNIAIKKLIAHGHPIIALGNKKGSIDTIIIETEKKQFENIDTITLYISAAHQPAYYDYLLTLKPKRIIFNPGTENETFFKMVQQSGITALEACTLVLLSTNQY